jgi:hypothetical protein
MVSLQIFFSKPSASTSTAVLFYCLCDWSFELLVDMSMSLSMSSWCSCWWLEGFEVLFAMKRHNLHLTPHQSHLTPHQSHLTHHTSHVTYHTSHVTYHTSHVTHHTSQPTPDTSQVAHRGLFASLVLVSRNMFFLKTAGNSDDTTAYHSSIVALFTNPA